MMRRPLPLILALLALNRCERSPAQPRLCVITAEVTPGTPSLAVGDTVRLSASYVQAASGCDPRVPVTGLRWRSADPAIATVDSVRGVVTGLSRGTVPLSVHEPGSDTALGAVTVTVWEPLFDRIIYTRVQYPCPAGPNLCPPGLWTIAPDGSDRRLVIDSLNWPEHPRVSPDGREVVYENWSELYIVDAGGLNKRQIATGHSGNYTPSWSVDGKWILLSAWDPSTSVSQVFLIHPDGTGLRQLTSDARHATYPAWGPDGRDIVYVRVTPDPKGAPLYEAVAMDSSGGNPRVLTAGVTNFRGRGPAWSPDGTTILFLDAWANWSINRLTLATSRYEMIASAEGNRPGEWSPDGQQIVFGTGDLWLMDPDGTNPRIVLSDDMLNFEAAWTPPADRRSGAAYRNGGQIPHPKGRLRPD